ncbi:MAG: insulinase family protein [Clostridia bacterium]|nr:insulinase family protein [Clostridia bacterium]
MKLFEKHLGAGITFRAIPKDIFKTDSLILCFSTPLEKKTAAVRAMLPPVLGRGCEKYPDLEKLSEHLDELYYANVDCRTARTGEVQTLTFSVRALETACVPEHEDVFLSAMETLAELMLHPLIEDGGFRNSYVDTEKKNAIDAIRSQISNKEAYATARCVDEMCADEPFGQCRYKTEDVEAVTPLTLYSAYLDVLAHAPVDIYYVGKRDPETLAEQVMTVFAGLLNRTGEILWNPSTTVLRAARHSLRRTEEDQPARQGKLIIGFRSGSILSDGDFYITALFNELYGGSPTSRLFLRVREEMSLCYYCSSGVDAAKGLMFVSSGIHPDRREEAEEAIFGQLADLAAGNISDEEFDEVKKSLCTGYRMLEDSASSLVSWYHARAAAGIDTSPDETAAQVMAVTKEQVAAAAAKMTPDTVFFMNATLAGEDGGEEEADDDGEE